MWEIRWGVPLVTLTYIAARGAQKRGMQGVGKKPKADLCMARLHAMMLTRLRELGVRR